MTRILPPEAGLEIQGIFHRYTITKDSSADATVSITNKNAIGTGNIYERHDNWNQLPGNTKIGFDLVPTTPSNRWGEGRINVDGDASLSNVIVAYNYRFDPCFIPLSDPSCPNYDSALYKYLIDNNLINNEPSIDDPYFDEWVQFQLGRKSEQKEEEDAKEEAEKEEEKENNRMERALSVASIAIEISNPLQQLDMMSQIIVEGTLDGYYGATIEGGTYGDTVALVDTEIKDNYKALRNLAQDGLHRKIVRSQYDK